MFFLPCVILFSSLFFPPVFPLCILQCIHGSAPRSERDAVYTRWEMLLNYLLFLRHNLSFEKVQRMTTNVSLFMLIGSRASEWLPTLSKALQDIGALRTVEPDSLLPSASLSSFLSSSLSSSVLSSSSATDGSSDPTSLDFSVPAFPLPGSGQSIFFIIDSTYVEDVPGLIGHIRKSQPCARVLVVTSSPSWLRARDALKAGAVDYIKKSLDAENLRQSVEIALQRTVPELGR